MAMPESSMYRRWLAWSRKVKRAHEYLLVTMINHGSTCEDGARPSRFFRRLPDSRRRRSCGGRRLRHGSGAWIVHRMCMRCACLPKHHPGGFPKRDPRLVPPRQSRLTPAPARARNQASTCTRIAEARPRSAPRAASISAARSLSGRPSAAAIARNARQNSGSSETEVRCPFSVSECFSGRPAAHASGSSRRCPSSRRRSSSASAPRPLGLGGARRPPRVASPPAPPRRAPRCLRTVRRFTTLRQLRCRRREGVALVGVAGLEAAVEPGLPLLARPVGEAVGHHPALARPLQRVVADPRRGVERAPDVVVGQLPAAPAPRCAQIPA